jgi:hypothetical protein
VNVFVTLPMMNLFRALDIHLDDRPQDVGLVFQIFVDYRLQMLGGILRVPIPVGSILAGRMQEQNAGG